MATVCPRRLDSIYTLTYYMKWTKTSWTDSSLLKIILKFMNENTMYNYNDFIIVPSLGP